MATYEAYVTLGDASVAVSTVDVPLTVRSETAAVSAPTALLTLLMPVGATSPAPNIKLLPKSDVKRSAEYADDDEEVPSGHPER